MRVARHDIQQVGSVARAKYKSVVRKKGRAKTGNAGKHGAPLAIEVRRWWKCGVAREQL
jgi:hypothetical protein